MESDQVDMMVGRMIKARRVQMGMSQMKLAKMVGVTYQQMFKYEAGKNRITAGRLYRISLALEIRVQDFFDGAGDPTEPARQTLTRVSLTGSQAFASLRPWIQRAVLDFMNELNREDGAPGRGSGGT